MTIIVTGATGFIGRHVVNLLLSRGHSVVAVVRDEKRAKEQEWFPRVRFAVHDLQSTSTPPLSSALHGADLLLDLAWSEIRDYTGAVHLERNWPGHQCFITSLVEQGLRRVLVTGTCLEYGMQEGCLAEEMTANPVVPYAVAKDKLRRSLEALRETHPFVLQWMRVFYIYGPGQNSSSVLAQLDRAIDLGEPEFNMSGGHQLRDYLPIQEVARLVVGLGENSTLQGIYNCCSGEPISINELVERRVRERGSRIKLNRGYYPYPPYEPMAFWGSAAKIREARLGELCLPPHQIES